jgi:hypothetical protein
VTTASITSPDLLPFLLLVLLLLPPQVALDLSKLQEFTGREKPTVIT